MTQDVLGQIRAALPRLSAAEARVAGRILDDPRGSVELTIAQLADASGASQATVNRLCHSIGYSGYRPFRLELAAATSFEEATRARFDLGESDIDPSDGARAVATKIAYQETSAIEHTARELDLGALDAVAAAVRAAGRIDVFGVGASALTAQDLQQKLARIGLPSFTATDPHLALSSAALRSAGDVAIAISHTGETPDTIRPLDAARRAHATTVAVTNFPGSTLAGAADHVLTTHARESPFRSGAMSSRIAQLTVVDILFIRVAQLDPAATAAALSRTFDAVRGRD